MKNVFSKLKRLVPCGKAFPADARDFGWHAAAWLWLTGVMPSRRGAAYIAFLTKYIDRIFAPVTEQFANGSHDADLHVPEDGMIVGPKPIWICWLQGEENMPELVRACYGQLKRNAPDGAEIHLLTAGNYSKYVTVPEHVEEKFHDGRMSIPAFTDILRSSLLYAYGGMWIDSTVWTANEIPTDFFERPFHSPKTRNECKYPKEPSRGAWANYLMGGQKRNVLFCYIRNTLCHYWKKYDRIVEYILPDYAILAAYNNLPECKRDIDAVPCNNEDLGGLHSKLNEAYDEKTYSDLTKDTTFFKLTYKMAWRNRTESGDETYYKHFCDMAKSEVTSA